MKQALHMSVREFCRGVKTNRVFSDLPQAVFDATGRGVSPAEKASWEGSLPRLTGALELAGLPDTVYIGLEVPVPYYSQRIDAVLYGHDKKKRPSALLIELKQWSEATSSGGGRINVRMRGGLAPVVHPSLQVDGYRRYIANFVRACRNEPPVQMACCVYAHNYPDRSGALFEPEFSDAIERAPIFCATDAERLAEFINAQVGHDHGEEIYDRIRLEGLAPSDELIARATKLIREQNLFTMLDEQIPAQTSILRALRDAIRTKRKSVILVEGGPGTGKSVMALDAFGRALREKYSTYMVSGSSAFTHGMRELLGRDLESLVRFTDFFWNHAEDSVDVLIVDEAHRIRAKSVPRVPSEQRPKISQIEELISAAKVTVLFMDTNQIIEPDERGDPSQVQTIAERLRANFSRHQLRSQFRCDGSDEYLIWVDQLFNLRPPDGQVLLDSPASFDFDVFDSPHDIVSWVQERNDSEPNSARVTAGWCWPWSDPLLDGTLINDIVIGDFEFPWELKSGKRGKPGIPEAKYWAVDPGGVHQAGTVYSVQGFEFRHVGVIMGPDLIVRDGAWIANPKANFRNTIRGKSPDVAGIYIRRIYRALFTRPLRSIRVYSVDDETRRFLRSRTAREYTP